MCLAQTIDHKSIATILTCMTISMFMHTRPLDNFFSSGTYTPVVTYNTSMHHEAMEALRELAAPYLNREGSVRFLDIACGGQPVTPHFLARNARPTFKYTGVDIDPNQIRSAQSYAFEGCAIKPRFLIGDGWNLDDVPELAREQFDIVFTGLNLHHGTPEEIFYALQSIKQKMLPGALLLIHDEFRPPEATYFRRPMQGSSGQSLQLVNHDRLTAIPTLEIPESRTDWRHLFFATYRDNIEGVGISEETAQKVIDHISEYDYALSLAEMTVILEMLDFQVTAKSFASTSHPVGMYFGVMMATL